MTGGELAGVVRSTLERNWAEGEREGVRFAYTRSMADIEEAARGIARFCR